MITHTFVSKNSVLSKTGSVLLAFAMIAASFSALVTPFTARAASNYVISGALTVDGLHVDASGLASANTYTGQPEHQSISINWDFGGPADAWVTVVPWTELNFDPVLNGNGGVILDTPWTTSHAYLAPGTYTIKALIHHQQPQGNESGAQVFQQTVEITYQCSDGVDNDDDGQIDYPADIGCSSGTDDDEFNAVIQTGTLSVRKVIVGGPEVSPSSFAFEISDGTYAPFEMDGINDYSYGAGTLFSVVEDTYEHYDKAYDGCSGTIVAGETLICTITNTFKNTAPVATDDSATTDEDIPFSDTLTGSDASSDSFVFSIFGVPANGVLSPIDLTTGAFTYTPHLNYYGPDSFTFQVTDSFGMVSNTATFSIDVASVNDNPDALNDTANVAEDSTDNVINVLVNDTAAPDVGETLTVTSVDAAVNGTVSLDAGVVKFTPTAGYVGNAASFTYTIFDGNGGIDSATVTVHVSNSADAPVAVGDAYSTDEDVPLVVTAPGVLSNDSDADSDPMSAVKVSDPSKGAVTLNADGSFTYTPNADETGADSFTYKVSANGDESSVVTVAITINPINDAPVSSDDSITTDQNTSIAGSLIASDIDGDDVDFATTSNPTSGILTLNPETGAYTYMPNLNFVGSDSFTFTATDGSLVSNVATVSITVNPLTENTLVECSDEMDNDNDGDTNLEDSDCAPFMPTLTINKVANGGDGTFSFNVSTEESDPVIETEEGSGTTGALTLNQNGEVSISENVPEGWTFEMVSCELSDTNESASWDSEGSYVSISGLNAGDSAVCTYTNDIIPTGSDVSVTKTVDNAAVDNGQNVTFTLTVVNNGPAIASDVVVTDLLPAGLVFVSTSTEDVVGVYSTSTGEWVIGSLAAQATTTLHITATVNAAAGTQITNTATSSHENSETNDGNDDSSVSVTVNTPVAPSGGGGGGGGGNGPIFGGFGGGSIGQVLGASTSLPELPPGCTALLHTYMRQGRKANDTEEVKTLQQFLNDYMSAGLPVTGTFGPMTKKAVNAFQTKHTDQVLTPWGLTAPTGFVYLTTQRWINLVHCSTLNIPIPELIPFRE